MVLSSYLYPANTLQYQSFGENIGGWKTVSTVLQTDFGYFELTMRDILYGINSDFGEKINDQKWFKNEMAFFESFTNREETTNGACPIYWM